MLNKVCESHDSSNDKNDKNSIYYFTHYDNTFIRKLYESMVALSLIPQHESPFFFSLI